RTPVSGGRTPRLRRRAALHHLDHRARGALPAPAATLPVHRFPHRGDPLPHRRPPQLLQLRAGARARDLGGPGCETWTALGAGPGRPWVPRQRWSAETTVRTPLSRRSTVVSTVVRVRRAPRSMTTWDSRLCASHLNTDRRRVRSSLAHLATIHS